MGSNMVMYLGEEETHGSHTKNDTEEHMVPVEWLVVDLNKRRSMRQCTSR